VFLEYCSEGTLEKFVKENKLNNPIMMKEFVFQIAAMYLELLSHSVFHRDFKPDNIVIHLH